MNHLSPLRLERHLFDHIHLESLPEREKGAKVKLNVEFQQTQRVNEISRVQLALRVTFEPQPGGKLGYKGVVQIIGAFRLDPTTAAEAVDALLASEGAALLYGAVRELVCNLTARGPWPMVRLPNISFDQPPEPKSKSRSKRTGDGKVSRSESKAL